EGDFPFLCSKPSGGEGKRTKGKRCGSNVAPGAAPSFIVKTVDDPDEVLGKRRKARILSECADNLALDVMYSMDKKNRWSQANAVALLNGVTGDEVSAQVVETRMPPPVCYFKSRNVTAVHEIDEDGDVVTRTAKGQGVASLSSLSAPPRGKQRGSHARREAAARLAAEEEERNGVVAEDAPEEAKIRYTIMHDQPYYHGRFVRRRGSPKSRRARVKRVDPSLLDELEHSELERSVHIEEDGYKPSRDLRFCLGDYMTSKARAAEFVRQESVESSKHPSDIVKLDMPEDEMRRPFDLVDISTAVRAPSTFEFVYMDPSSWSNFKFVAQVEALRDRFTVRWLDVNYQRVLIDATDVFLRAKGYSGKPMVVIVLERCWNKDKCYLKVFLNTTIAAEEDFSWKLFKEHLMDSDVSDIRTVVEATLLLPQKWRARGGVPIDEVVTLKQRKEYLPAFNATSFARPIRRITDEHMANVLREECEQLDGGSFEKVTDFDSELEDETLGDGLPSDGSPVVPAGAKCRSCSTDRGNNLYEMDDCWMCRNCLKQLAIHQIRVKSLPINLPLVVPEGVTSYDVLPSILPLPLFNFYTKLAAIELIEDTMNDVIELSECPGCKQMVDVFGQNEYNCALCECGIVWCTECKKEPHWPMSCSAAAEWTRRWKHSVSGDAFLREITCSCLGPPIVNPRLLMLLVQVGGDEVSAKCDNCNTEFDPLSMMVLSRNGRIREFTAVKYKTVPNVNVPRIKKEIVNICEKVRGYRFDTAKVAEMEKACRKLKGIVPRPESLREVRQTVLYIVEYGMAWLYMEKSIEDRAIIKTNLVQLLRLYEELVAIIDYQRPNFVDCVEALNGAVQKTIDLIKKNL
ncbi:unnamed protein product, partial [Heligmosomoides polygyrus]|uniref:ULP_PROTEASE domain-containing protein n=1 Tax=Heligmosomoides polygyrus TaxID=6339 RepID=A0A183FQ55_HELPZ